MCGIIGCDTCNRYFNHDATHVCVRSEWWTGRKTYNYCPECWEKHINRTCITCGKSGCGHIVKYCMACGKGVCFQSNHTARHNSRSYCKMCFWSGGDHREKVVALLNYLPSDLVKLVAIQIGRIHVKDTVKNVKSLPYLFPLCKVCKTPTVTNNGIMISCSCGTEKVYNGICGNGCLMTRLRKTTTFKLDPTTREWKCWKCWK